MEDSQLPGFRTFIKKFYDTCFAVEQDILRALATALKISEYHLLTLHNKAENEFRLLHYQAIPPPNSLTELPRASRSTRTSAPS
jgi:isopenicillin N synthase-like dioxygenase